MSEPNEDRKNVEPPSYSEAHLYPSHVTSDATGSELPLMSDAACSDVKVNINPDSNSRDEETRSHSSDYVLLSRIDVNNQYNGPPTPGSKYSYKNCNLVFHDSMSTVRYVWKEGKVQAVPVDKSNANGPKRSAGLLSCAFCAGLLLLSIVILFVITSSKLL
ncbi:hypothetical protein SNE40_002332 [Patella caerulea]|uniref:Uncharacterized protein n=1 Tax=Patella caerulea TaxID=87958 RepID=A0AAN8KBL2_PATCE